MIYTRKQSSNMTICTFTSTHPIYNRRHITHYVNCVQCLLQLLKRKVTLITGSLLSPGLVGFRFGRCRNKGSPKVPPARHVHRCPETGFDSWTNLHSDANTHSVFINSKGRDQFPSQINMMKPGCFKFEPWFGSGVSVLTIMSLTN